MRIAVLHNRYREPGGEDAVVEQEIQLLRDRGHEVRLHLADNRMIARGGVRLAAQTIWSREAMRAVGRFLDEAPVDVMHVHNTFPLLSPSVYASAREREIPVVQTLHNFRLMCPAATFFRAGRVCTDCQGRSVPWPSVAHACYRHDRAASAVVASMLAINRARDTWRNGVDAFIALTEFARRQFVAGGLAENSIHVRPNFAVDPGDELFAARRDDGVAVFVGRLSEEKGIDVLVRAWKGVDIPLTVLGDGPLRGSLESAAPAHVSFKGRVSQERVREELVRSAFLVVPSVCLEGFPMAVLEAYGLGVPVVASDLGSLAEIVDGETGVLFEAGDAASLEAAAADLGTQPARRRVLGRKARERFLERYTPEAGYSSLLEVYGRATEVARSRIS